MQTLSHSHIPPGYNRKILAPDVEGNAQMIARCWRGKEARARDWQKLHKEDKVFQEQEPSTTSEDIQSDSDSNETTGPGTSGASQKNHQQDNILVIIDEEDADDDMPVEDFGFSQKISVNKLTYLQGIFPDVQLGCLTKNLAQIGDDDTNFKIFLNKCLADPTRLPRQARVVPSSKRVHPGADAALEKNPVKAHIIKESSSSSKKRKKRSVGNSGKGMVKIAYDDEFECM